MFPLPGATEIPPGEKVSEFNIDANSCKDRITHLLDEKMAQ